MFSKTLEWQSVTKLRDGNATADQKHLHDGKWRNTREKAMKLLVMIGCFFSSDSCLICLCYSSWLCLCYDILDCIRSQICCRFQLHCTNNIAGNKQHENWKMSFYFKGLTQHDSLPLKIICIFIAVFKKVQFTCSFPFAYLCKKNFFLLQTPPSVQTCYLGWRLLSVHGSKFSYLCVWISFRRRWWLVQGVHPPLHYPHLRPWVQDKWWYKMDGWTDRRMDGAFIVNLQGSCIAEIWSRNQSWPAQTKQHVWGGRGETGGVNKNSFWQEVWKWRLGAA